jgi:hypothetical protein
MEVKIERFPGKNKVAEFMNFLDTIKGPIISDAELREIFKKVLSFLEPSTLIVVPRIFDEIIMATMFKDSISFITRSGLRIQFYVSWASLSILCSVIRVEEDRWEE